MMNGRVRLLVAAVIVGVLLASGVRLWASGQAQDISGPTRLRLCEDGKVYAVTGEQLLVLTDTGELLDQIPLSRFGLHEFVGDFWVNAQQEILLRAQRPEGGLRRWLRVTWRIGGDGGDQMPEGIAALQWCPLAGGPCRPFGPSFRSTRTFHLAIEKASGAVLIADTAQHRLLRFDSKGALQGSNAEHFRFPNALLIGQDGLLYVADTNHHRIVAVALDVQGFGKPQREFAVQTASSTSDRRWPMGIAQTPDGAFWTINANGNMADGDLMVYGNDGHFKQKLHLPPQADPLSLLLVKDRVLVADPQSFQIQTFDLQGGPRRAFGDEAFNTHMAQLQRKRQRFAALSTGTLVAIVALALMAFAIQRRHGQQR